ncbi:MAG: hypothetical protein K2N25_06000 [Muribaculaceae bacterium]|nr:hypothetical protein [Muribaculaceae bacterium]
MEKETFYHGSGLLFQKFDLSHALEGDGKVKFGYGVYVTSSYPSAAHYSGANDDWTEHYVYTVGIPAKREDNFIAFKQPVMPSIVSRAEEKLGITLSDKVTADGKEFRKFLAKRFTPKGVSDKKLANFEGERLASVFLSSIGVDFIEWPYNWKNPALGNNRAVLDDSKVEIACVDTVGLDDKKNLISGSEKRVR